MLETDTITDLHKRLSVHLSYWAWVFHFYNYDSRHVVITEPYIIDWVRKARAGRSNCKFTTASEFRQVINADTWKIMVFTERQELALVRQLQSEFPDKVIVSGTYGYSCVGRDRFARLFAFKNGGVSKKVQPYLMISTPYAEAEFAAKVMAENGLPAFHEFLGRPFASWLQLHPSFQIARFYNETIRRYTPKGVLPWMLQTDVLSSLFENTNFSFARMVEFLKKNEIKVLLFNRKNTMEQAALAQFLGRTPERSIWTKKPSKKIELKYQPQDFLGASKYEEVIAAGQEMLDAFAGSGIAYHTIQFEDFAQNQQERTAEIAGFLGLEMPEAFETTDYETAYDETPDVFSLTSTYYREYIDRVGLHFR